MELKQRISIIIYIRAMLKEYIEKNKLKSLVIGVSGGIDSALCCALAAPVCGELNIPLIGRSITIQTNKNEEVDRARNIGKHFCTDFKETSVSVDTLLSIYNTIMEDYDDIEMDHNDINIKIRAGNIKARIRMMYLYDLARKNNGIVLSTDNYTELMLGFWTLHGDVGDFGMIQNLWKTDVYTLSKHIALHECKQYQDKQNALLECIDGIPTDGLGITDSDLEQLGANTYQEVDEILQEYFDLKRLNAQLQKPTKARFKYLEKTPVVQRHLNSKYKRNNPLNIPIPEYSI